MAAAPRILLSTLVCMLLLARATTIAGQASADARAVRAAVDSFFADIAAERWAAAAQRLSLRDFEQYLKRTIASARGQLPTPLMTVDELMAQDSTMPRAVAEWQLDRMRKTRDEYRFHDFSHEFAGVTTFQALVALSVTDAAARWVEARDSRTHLRQFLRQQTCPDSASNTARLRVLAGPLPADTPRVLAVALADDSTAYAIYGHSRSSAREQTVDGTSPPVLTLYRARGRWLILPRYDLLRQASGALVRMETPCFDPRRR